MGTRYCGGHKNMLTSPAILVKVSWESEGPGSASGHEVCSVATERWWTWTWTVFLHLSCLILFMSEILSSHFHLSSPLFVFPCSVCVSSQWCEWVSVIVCQPLRSTLQSDSINQSFVHWLLYSVQSLFKVSGSLDMLYSKVLQRKFCNFS